MNPSRKLWWLAYGLCATALLFVLGWATRTLLDYERTESEQRTAFEHEQALLHSLYRMDSWVSTYLAVEAHRSHAEYHPFFAHERAYSRLLSPIPTFDVWTPSPLLAHQSTYFDLHFQFDEQGEISSPQVPTGNFLDLTEATFFESSRIEEKRRLLEKVKDILQRDRAKEAMKVGEERLENLVGKREVQVSFEAPILSGRWRGHDWVRRAESTYDVQKQPTVDFARCLPYEGGETTAFARRISVGPLVPVWFGEPGARELFYLRRVDIGESEILQGVLCNWHALKASLLEKITDLFPQADLVPVDEVNPDSQQSALASVGVALRVPDVNDGAVEGVTSTRTSLGIGWGAALIAILLGATTLRSSIEFGKRRSRFASAVTHELRTPLTTFRLYTEMLADDMIREEEDRRSYLETLRSESERLSSVVENVLAYARLEEGRFTRVKETLTPCALFERLEGPLLRRASEVGMVLRVDRTGLEAIGETQLRVDVEAVGQILFNLVDNACKYASAGERREIDVTSRLERGWLEIRVRDYGPGISLDGAHRIFAPFERVHREGEEKIPGLGLGLALSRGLARELGGDVTLDDPADQGASFSIRLPVEPQKV